MRRLANYAPRGMLAVNPKALGVDFFLFETEEAPFRVEDDSAIVEVGNGGPLTTKAGWCWDSYEDIVNRVKAALASDAKQVVLCIDSPGGDAAGCLEAAHALRGLARAAGKKLIAWTETQACSAAYALACAADEIYVTPTGALGSVGVIDAFIDATALDAAQGIKYTFIISGARKADGNPHTATTPEAVANKQSQIDSLAMLFFGVVEELQGLPVSKVKALEAGVFYGAEAVNAGLAIGTKVWSEVVRVSDGVSKSNKLEGPTMAKSTLAELAARAEGDDEKDAKMARKALKALLADDGGEEPDGDEAPPKKEEKKEEAVAAKAEDGDKEEEKKKEEAKAIAATRADDGLKAIVLEQGRQLHAMKAAAAAREDAEKRAAILATRSDLGADVVKALSVVATKDLESVLATFPKFQNDAANAQNASATRGAKQGEGDSVFVPKDEADFVSSRMQLNVGGSGVKAVGNDLILGAMTPEQARKHLETLNGKAGN